MRYKKHYTREEAGALLPQIRLWLARLSELRGKMEKFDRRLVSVMAPGCDAGGRLVNDWVRGLVEFQELLVEFHSREIQVKDLDRGLIDFPAIIGGKEVFLCWENGEEDVEHWHELDAGYAGREKL